MKPAITAALALLITASAAQAQSTTAQLTRGVFNFTSNPVYYGEAGQPWDTRIEIGDSVIAGKSNYSIAQRSRFDGNKYRFNSTTTWAPGTLDFTKATWTGFAGDEYGECSVELRNGAAMLSINNGEAKPWKYEGQLVPEFAVAHALAAMDLKDGATYKLNVFHCSWHSGAEIALRMKPLNVTVKSDKLARTGKTEAEPAWLVAGDSSYPYQLWVAKSDRHVLKVVLPQGEVGEQVDVLVSTSKK